MPPFSKKCPSCNRPIVMPRAVLSSARLACPPPPCNTCSCDSIEVCTQDTCADSATCMQSSPGPEFCSRGLTPLDGQCGGACREPPPPPPPCPVCAQHLAGSESFQLNQPPAKMQQTYNQPPQGYRNSLQQPQSEPQGYGTPFRHQRYNPPGQTPTYGVPSTNTTSPPLSTPQSNVSALASCSSSCGTLKKQSKSNIDSKRQSLPGIGSKPQENADSGFKPDKAKSCCSSENMRNCCKSSSGIQTGPHMGAGLNDDGSLRTPSGKRRPSLVKIEDNCRLSLQEPLDRKSNENDPDAKCQHGAGLFPAPTSPCMCRMPPAFASVCTGNLSGTCKCVDCNKIDSDDKSKDNKNK